MTDPDGKQKTENRKRRMPSTLDSHPVEDEIYVLEIVVKREAGLKLIGADKPHHLLVVLHPPARPPRSCVPLSVRFPEFFR